MTETQPELGRTIRHGSSFPSFPGVILMNDYHTKKITVAETAENIVHETVHNMLFNMEFIAPWYDDKQTEMMSETVPSLWSTRRLPFYSFFHSLIVFSSIVEWLEKVDLNGEASAHEKRYLTSTGAKVRHGFKMIGHLDFAKPDFILERINKLGRCMYGELVAPRVNSTHVR